MGSDVLVSERAIQDLQSKRISGNDLVVLLVIGSLGQGSLSMSISDVAASTPLSRPTVSRSITTLEELGYVAVERSVNQNMAGEISILGGVACKKSLQAKGRLERKLSSAEQADSSPELGEQSRLSKDLSSAEQADIRDSRSTSLKDPEALRLTALFAESLHKIDPKIPVPSNLKTWALHMDRLLRIDKRTPDEVERVVAWLHADRPDKNASFWRPNVLSTQSLRRQMPRLMMHAQGTRSNGASQHLRDSVDDFNGLG